MVVRPFNSFLRRRKLAQRCICKVTIGALQLMFRSWSNASRIWFGSIPAGRRDLGNGYPDAVRVMMVPGSAWAWATLWRVVPVLRVAPGI